MKSDIVFITVQPEGENNTHRTFTRDFLLNGDPTEIGEAVQSMMESIENAHEDVMDEINKDKALDEKI